MKLSTQRCAVVSGIAIAIALASPAFAQSAPDEQDTANAPEASVGDIVVTARRRDETLNRVPVAVSVVSADAIARNNAIDLPKIAELTPTVIVSNYGANGGGSIAIRGISSPANNSGFEQAVSVAIDGVQTSDGHVAMLGFFDVKQVEVLKGPQALLFGKNNTAGVISIKTADPTPDLEISAKQSYEFVGDETTTDFAISGPLGDKLGIRIAGRYNHLDGWLRNTAAPIANPFYNPASGAPASIATLPGTSIPRPGKEEMMGRLTLRGQFGDVTARLKVFGAQTKDDGPGTNTQNIGPCAGPYPRVYGIADPTSECKVDRYTTVGDIPTAVASGMHNANTTGTPFGRLGAFTTSFDLSVPVGKTTINSATAYMWTKYHYLSGLDQTTYSQLALSDVISNATFSQELRLTSDFDGPFNFMLGGYYSSTKIRENNNVVYNHGNFNPVSARFDSYENLARQNGSTVSGFVQGMYDILPTVELAGGIRYTKERKNFSNRNIYGIGAFNNFNTVYAGSDEPGVIKGRFRDSNVSPEATLTWHPQRDSTLYIAYKTGFKGGGFGLSNPLQTTTQIGDIDFGSENAKGVEGGFKGLFLNNRLRVNLGAFLYKFSDLQVSTYDPVRFAYTVNNAGSVRQRGAEAELNFRVSDILTLHSAAAWVHNRYRDFVGPCYAYTFPTGSTRATAVPPPNCSFVNTTALTLQQDFSGRAPARSPEWSGNAGFELTLPAGSHKFGITGDAFYSDGYYASDTMAASTYQQSLWRFNAGVTFGSEDDKWSVGLVGRNLTNKYFLLYATDRTGGAGFPGAVGEQRGSVARGREVALQASVRF